MERSRRTRALVALSLAALVPLLGGDAVLQLLGGGIRGQALSPAVLALVLGLLGSLIVARRPQVRLGPLLLLNALGFGLGSFASGALDYGSRHPLPRAAAEVAFAVVWLTVGLVAAWVLFVLWFPDGAFTGRGWRSFSVFAAVLSAAVAVMGWLAGPADRAWGFYGGTDVPAGAAGPFAGTLPWLAGASSALLVLPLVALASLVQRYRNGTPVLRQQVRWLLVGMSAEIACQIVGAVVEPHGAGLHDLGVALSVGSQPLPMLGATVAILRYRLWEIDVVVSRALAYGALWAGLSALLVVPALAAGLLVGGRGALAAVGIALLLTVAFQPARVRLEALAERLVHPQRARPRALLAGFWETLRTSGLDEVGTLLADATRRGLDVEWAAVWLHSGGVLSPLAAVGPPVAVSSETAAVLCRYPGLVLETAPPEELEPLWPTPPGAVVPLVAGNELVGVLACGPRRGDTLGTGDFELLELLARGSAMRLRNLRLELQLRDRLVEIEAQADELRRSRQRLAAVQDEERRRIERDLHDGVQQQLVSLAVRLRRLADGREPLLADLAAEAEQSVFALQELARGIFPTVLADQGLTAALRTQAVRMPLAVHVEADDAVAGRRLDRELEAALYFVGLEALTNVQKHAPGASVSVRLERDEQRVLLEVTDDGAGFAARSRTGTGLQNMADRVAAVGGTLTIDSGRGGTRIRAAVAARAELQAAEADSRR